MIIKFKKYQSWHSANFVSMKIFFWKEFYIMASPPSSRNMGGTLSWSVSNIKCNMSNNF